jgi:aryl-alcohol dehydrogenase-like predicted oxidoreductase
MESLHASLRRLQTDYVDVYQAHRYDYATPLEETMQAFADLVHAGKVHYIGVSEWRAEEIRAAYELATDLRVQLVSNQPRYSILWRVIEAEVIPTCAELGIGQIVWSPLAEGVLTGKYLPGQPPPLDSRAAYEKPIATYITDYLGEKVLSAVQAMAALAEQAGLTRAQLALAWVLQNPNVSSAIVGASRPAQLAENVKASGVRLEADLLKAVDDLFDALVDRDPAKTQSPATRP